MTFDMARCKPGDKLLMRNGGVVTLLRCAGANYIVTAHNIYGESHRYSHGRFWAVGEDGLDIVAFAEEPSQTKQTMKQYHWVLQGGYGVAWLESEHPDWCHDDAAKHAGIVGNYAKGVMFVNETSSICVITTPDKLNDLDVQQLQSLTDNPVVLKYCKE